MTRTRWVAALALVAVAACQGTPAGTPPVPPVTPPSPVPVAPTPLPPPAAPDMDAPIACATDADCPHLACGPCAPGTPVTSQFTRVNCARNPCPGTVAVCADHRCVVR